MYVRTYVCIHAYIPIDRDRDRDRDRHRERERELEVLLVAWAVGPESSTISRTILSSSRSSRRWLGLWVHSIPESPHASLV